MVSDFKESRWSKREFAASYAERADDFIPERKRLIEIAASYYKHFLAGRKTKKILDLGCGDGIMAEALIGLDSSVEATLIDASADMLSAAKERLSGSGGVRFVESTFDELLSEDPLAEGFDFVVSSLAIHHLDMAGKRALFEYVHRHLTDGGGFLIVDVVLSPTEGLEDWYLKLWSEWIEARGRTLPNEGAFATPGRYKENPSNTPDTLSAQMLALEETGFKEVDCYYKYGIFSVFGGRR